MEISSFSKLQQKNIQLKEKKKTIFRDSIFLLVNT